MLLIKSSRFLISQARTTYLFLKRINLVLAGSTVVQTYVI